MVQFLQMVFRLGLRTKLLTVALGLLAILTAGALLTVRMEFGQQLHGQAERDLRAGSHVLSSILERSGLQLEDRGKIFSELPSLHAALTKEREQLEPLLLEVKTIRAANLLWATDPQGIVLGSTGEYPPLGENLSRHPLVAAALGGRQTFGFDLFAGEWWLLLVLPVKEPTTHKLLGTVAMALLVGEAYLARLSEMIGCQVGFLWGESRIWSKGWSENTHQAIAAQMAKAFSGSLQELQHPEGRTLWLARSVTGGNPPIVSGPVAILGIQLNESVILRTTRAIGWIASITMAIGTLLLVWSIRSMTRPVKALVADTQRIGMGDLSHRSQVKGQDEIAELAVSFNQMVDRLEKSYKELAELNRTLEERVQERTKQLEEAQIHLLQAEKLASIGQLAAGVAHELNNPLMVIMGNTQLALRTLEEGERVTPEIRARLKELLDDLNREAHRSKIIVRNLLDFSRVTPPTHTEVDVHILLDDSLKLVAHQAGLQSVEVVKKYRKNLPKVKGDPGQLKQVFVNVILNAVQAMPKGGRLILETNSSNTHLSISVQDTGMGIPEENIPKVFDPFFTTKEVGQGTGLGLFVSYGIIQRHNGNINLTSRVGEGTTVSIELPIA